MNKYKKTKIGLIPYNWESLKFKDISKINQGLQIAIDERFKEKKDNRKPYITLQYLRDKSNYDNSFFVENPKSSVLCEKKDILMTRTGNTGVVVTNEEGVFHNNFFKIDFDRNKINKNYLYWYLISTPFQNLIKRYAGTTTIPDLNHSDFYRLPIIIPPLAEQEKIAKILDSVDNHISKVKNMIDDLKDLKKGLMQKVLTQGIGHTEFKDSPIGRLPVEWEVKRLGEIFPDLKAGSTPSRKIESYYKGKIPWITSGELNYNIIYKTLETITEKAIQDTNLKIYPIGTFFIAITGLEAAGTRGSCAISGIEATTNQSCMAFIPKKKFSNKYLFYWYQLNGENLAFKHAQGTKQQSFNNKIVANFEISVPPLKEQEKIVKILDSVDERIDTYKNEYEDLKELKKGLKQQLLTGKKRVKIDG